MPSTLDDLEKALASCPEQVLVLAGAGVACATDTNPCAYWPGLLKDGLERCRERCHTLSPDWATITELQIGQNTAEELIQAASRIEKALRGVHDSEYARWLSDAVGSLQLNDRRVIDAMLSWQTRVATTNYDNLFEDASGLRPVTWDQRSLALQFLRRELHGILHLHGHYLFADSVVFGSRTYEEICRDDETQNLLRSMFTRDTIVFVGCGSGVDDPNFGGLLKWTRVGLRNCHHSHYHLVRESEVQSVAEQYQALRVTPIVYGRDYADLAPFLEQMTARVHAQRGNSAPLAVLALSQSDYESQRLALEAQSGLSPLEFVSRSFEIARSLWNAGGRRAAALHMEATLRTKGNQLPVAERVAFTLDAAEYLLTDGLGDLATELLGTAEALLSESSCLPGLDRRFRHLVTRCLTARAELDKLFQSIEVSIPNASPAERVRLEAERAELHMLSGNLRQAEYDLTSEDGA